MKHCCQMSHREVSRPHVAMKQYMEVFRYEMVI